MTPLKRVRAGESIDARGGIISSERLGVFIHAVKIDGQRVLPDCDFRGATFRGDADFHAVTFVGRADFSGATFAGEADFSCAAFTRDVGFADAVFAGDARFGAARAAGAARFTGADFRAGADFLRSTFEGDVDFGTACFTGDARFGEATFAGIARFSDSTFKRGVRFSGATFTGPARFREVIFGGYARFRGATFAGAASFREATFGGYAHFGDAKFGVRANFRMANFEQARELGPLIVDGALVLDGCVFAERVTILAAANVISGRATIFAAGAHVRVRGACVTLDDADFARASTLSFINVGVARTPSLSAGDRPDVALEWPRLATLRGAYVAGLSLSEVDLRSCRFFGAYGLESLSIAASCIWPRTPKVESVNPLARRYMDRDTIADEHDWRGSEWSALSSAPASPATGVTVAESGAIDVGARAAESEQMPPDAMQIAALYRALRKAREDDKDEAGATDLYYGEMEMRRQRDRAPRKEKATGRPREGSRNRTAAPDERPMLGREPRRTRARRNRGILHLYWLCSGYGLRSRRALTSLALTLLIGAALLSWFGFASTTGHGYAGSLIYALESSISLLRAPKENLSPGGQIVDIALRLLGPLFFALALLAVRARVKR